MQFKPLIIGFKIHTDFCNLVFTFYVIQCTCFHLKDDILITTFTKLEHCSPWRIIHVVDSETCTPGPHTFSLVLTAISQDLFSLLFWGQRYNSHYCTTHPLKLYNSVVFSLVTALRNDHHNLFLKQFHHPKKKLLTFFFNFLLFNHHPSLPHPPAPGNH